MENQQTNKDLLKEILKVQQKQNKDLTEIKGLLLGNTYHRKGLIDEVYQNGECIDDIKNKKLPDIEIGVEKRLNIAEQKFTKKFGFVGSLMGFVVFVITFIANFLIFKNR